MTRTDYQKLQKMAQTGEISDRCNPALILNSVSIKMLAMIANGEVDLKKLAEYRLEDRGYNKDGEYVGFKRNRN